jgi:fimbrial chaperone protein
MAKPIMAISGNSLVVSSRFSLLLTVLFLLAANPAALAFTLVPITMEFEPAGRGANQSFRLENDSSNSVPVQISMLTRQMDLNGVETNAPAEDDFLVYPPQVLLKPNQVQTVRVKWLGTPKPEKELTYRILAEQLPVELDKEKANVSRINVMVRYLGSVYIVPKGAKADVLLESAVPQTDAAGKRQIELIFHNRGTAHSILRDLRLKIQAGDITVELGPEALPNFAGENMLAGQKRRFTLPWPEGLPDGPLRVTFDFSKRS